MQARPWIAGFATLVLAGPGLSAVKTYVLDADQSTRFHTTDQRIYLGDCDPGAATPNAGDYGPLADDQCKCTPGVDCALGSVPIPMICDASSPRVGLNCYTHAECSPGFCQPAIFNETCVASEGRPNGGSCDPSIAFPGVGSCAPGYPTRGSPEPPCNLTDGGLAVIDDTGNGTPTLVSLSLVSTWDDVFRASAISGIPGTTVTLHSESTLGPAANQTGTGSSTSTILWGTLTGWTRGGELVCATHCPGGCGPAGACWAYGTVEGAGPPFPLKAGSFNTDPWVFAGDEFTAASIEIVAIPGFTTEAVQIGGRQIEVPLLPLSALAGLAAGLAYLGTRALRTRSERRAAGDAIGSD